MKRHNMVDEFMENLTSFKNELAILRSILLETALKEEIKWGAPTYTFNGKNVVGLGAFKSYFGIWFFQGGLLKDDHKKLLNAQKGKTKAMRQWRFATEIEIEKNLIHQYIAESIENFKAGKEIKPDRTKPIIIPEELMKEFEKDQELKDQFEQLTFGEKRDYTEYITSAKRAATKLKRLDKIVPMIKVGIGLNDQYK